MNFGSIDNYMLLGGGELIAETAQHLQEQRLPVVLVTSDRHAQEEIFGRESLMSFLGRHGIETLLSGDVNKDSEVRRRITSGTLGISMGAAWIFRQGFIDLFGNRLVNLHGTRLPQDRGGGGYSWRILRNDRSGVSLIHLVDAGVDTGELVAWEEYVFPAHCRLPQDFFRYGAQKYKPFLLRFLAEVQQGKDFPLARQSEYLSAYWPRLATAVHGFIDWHWQLTAIESFICAFDDPYAGAATFVNDRKVRLKSCHATAAEGRFHPFQNGIIFRLTADAVFVATEAGALLVGRVLTDEGADARPYLAVGDRFYTPQSYLEEAMRFRAVYTPAGLRK